MEPQATPPTPPGQAATLEELLAQLHEANQRFADVSEGLKHLNEIDLKQREELATKLRAAGQEAEAITQQINEFMKQQR